MPTQKELNMKDASTTIAKHRRSILKASSQIKIIGFEALVEQETLTTQTAKEIPDDVKEKGVKACQNTIE